MKSLLFLLALSWVIGVDTYKKYNINNLICINVPKNWTVLSEDSKTTLDAYATAIVKEKSEGEIVFAANRYENDRVVALLNIRVYPNQEISQADVKRITPLELSELSKESMYSLINGFKNSEDNVRILKWHGLKKIKINGKWFILVSYLRKNSVDISEVFLYRCLDEGNSFTITMSYVKSNEVPYKSIIKYIENSVKNLQ